MFYWGCVWTCPRFCVFHGAIPVLESWLEVIGQTSGIWTLQFEIPFSDWEFFPVLEWNSQFQGRPLCPFHLERLFESCSFSEILIYEIHANHYKSLKCYFSQFILFCWYFVLWSASLLLQNSAGQLRNKMVVVTNNSGKYEFSITVLTDDSMFLFLWVLFELPLQSKTIL